MKIIRTVVLALSILVSIFFVVYAFIQQNEAHKREKEANLLLTELQHAKEQSEKEIAQLQEKLEACQEGEGE